MPTFPPGFERTKYRSRSNFRVNFGTAIRDVQRQANLMDATQLRIDTDIPMRQDGTAPLAAAFRKEIPDPGVVVYWTKNGTQYAIACDKWSDVASNMRAIAYTLKAKRDIARWGAATEKAEYEGYRALPPPSSSNPADYLQPSTVTPPHVILGVHERASKTEIKQAYRNLVLEAHPDRGGSSERLGKITEAYQTMMQGAP